MEILQREGKEVPAIVRQLAALDIDNLDVLDRKKPEIPAQRRRGRGRTSGAGASLKNPVHLYGLTGNEGRVVTQVFKKDQDTVVVLVDGPGDSAVSRAFKSLGFEKGSVRLTRR